MGVQRRSPDAPPLPHPAPTLRLVTCHYAGRGRLCPYVPSFAPICLRSRRALLPHRILLLCFVVHFLIDLFIGASFCLQEEDCLHFDAKASKCPHVFGAPSKRKINCISDLFPNFTFSFPMSKYSKTENAGRNAAGRPTCAALGL